MCIICLMSNIGAVMHYGCCYCHIFADQFRDVYASSKTPTQVPYGLLKPLPVPKYPCSQIRGEPQPRYDDLIIGIWHLKTEAEELLTVISLGRNRFVHSAMFS